MLKHYAVWHVGIFIGTLAHRNEKLALFCHVGIQAPRYLDHVGTQAQMARDLANQKSPKNGYLQCPQLCFFFKFQVN